MPGGKPTESGDERQDDEGKNIGDACILDFQNLALYGEYV